MEKSSLEDQSYMLEQHKQQLIIIFLWGWWTIPFYLFCSAQVKNQNTQNA